MPSETLLDRRAGDDAGDLLEVRDLGVSIPHPDGDIHAVRNVSLSIEPGDNLYQRPFGPAGVEFGDAEGDAARRVGQEIFLVAVGIVSQTTDHTDDTDGLPTIRKLHHLISEISSTTQKCTDRGSDISAHRCYPW